MYLIVTIVIWEVLVLKVAGFYDPQTYMVKMYHHEMLTLKERGEAKQDTVFLLKVNSKHYQIYNSKRLSLGSPPFERGKRDTKSTNKQNSDISSEFSNSQEYDGVVENDHKNNKTYEYDYETFKNEYYNEQTTEKAQTIESEEYEDAESPTPLYSKKPASKSDKNNEINPSAENYCNVVLLFRIRVVQCLWLGLISTNTDLMVRAGWVIVFWLVMYMSIASYLWCTKGPGWCCCCCPCSLCHPRSVIQEAKEFLAKNPPGVADTAQHGQITYNPTDFELLCYRDLEKDVFNF